MELIIKTYGKFLLEGMAVILLFGLLFAQIEDADGNRGILHIIGANLEIEEAGTTRYEDFEAYQSESSKNAPVISYAASGALSAGTHLVTDCISAVDYAGTVLSVGLLGMWEPKGMELDVTSLAAKGQLVFEDSGIYTVKVAAIDKENRRTVCLIQLPVN